MPATIQKRTAKRSRVLLSAMVELASGEQAARIRDVSTSGALVELTYPPIIDEGIELRCGDAALRGRVAWVDGSWCGIEFLAPLATGVLVDSLGCQLKVSAPRQYRRDRPQQQPDEPVDFTPRVIRFQGPVN